MQVQPANVTERFFTIFVVIFALVGFSYVVGSITGGLTQLRGLQEESTKLFWNLRRFLKQNKVPMELKVRVRRYLEHAWENRQKRLQPVKNIPIFSLLSEQLTCELQASLFIPHLSIQPLFKRLNEVSSVSTHRLANSAIAPRHLARKDRLFEHDEHATHMYLVVAGRLQYLRTDSEGEPHLEFVDHDEDWISEHVLWVRDWIHVGGLKAITECDLLTICPQLFARVICLNPSAKHLARVYAKNFLVWINSVLPDSWSDIIQGDEVSSRHEQFMELEIDECHSIYGAQLSHLNFASEGNPFAQFLQAARVTISRHSVAYK